MEISKKKLLAITLVLTTFLAMFAVFGPIVVSTEYIDVDDYCWIEGVLHSDTYTLYPYAEESLDIGFSKYGEMIGYNEDTEIGLGLQYPGYESAGNTYDQTDDTSVDPFCNEYIGEDWWMNGWFIDIKYRTPAGVWREIWAFALFSDGQQHGGDWIVMPSVSSTSAARPLWQEYAPFANPDSTEYAGIVDPIPAKGGRKTNGLCTTDPIEIIYNGPRRFIALCKTTISDVGGGADLVAIYFTFIFNKAEKNVIILKDVKRLYTKQPMNIQFGNRGEWDLGIEGDTDSYTHWYTDHPVQYWDMDDDGTINGTEVATSFEFFRRYFLAFKNPKKWWDDVPYADRPTEVFNEWTEVIVDFPDTWLETQYTCYGRDWHWDKTIKEHSYAVAQVISRAGDYVGALAVWPHPEFWSAANTFFPPERTVAPAGNNPSSIPLMLAPISRMLNWHKWTVEEDPNQGEAPLDIDDRDNIWVKADDIRAPDGSTMEPIIPFIIYEHDFQLSSTLPEYRVVSVYMLTDYHDADDADADDPGNEESWSMGYDIIDREIQYQLDEIFDPWDIYDAMHKNTKRWVQFFDRDYDGHAWDGENYYCIQLDDYREIESGELIPSLPVINYGDWDAYCSFSERVLVDTGTGYELIYPIWYNWLDPIPNDESPYYVISYTTGIICFYEWDDDLDDYVIWYLPEGSIVKVLWSSEHHATTAEQWDENDLLYPIDGETFIFPLHHDEDYYDELTEVFLIEQPPQRIYNTTLTDGTPYYAIQGATLTVYNCSKCKEIDIKYYETETPDSWHEEKFHSNGSETQVFTLNYTATYVEKVWIHSEKAITRGQYVFNNATKTIYMQDPVTNGEWLQANYTVSGVGYINFFLGNGKKNVFTLQGYPDVGSLHVYNTKIVEQIVNETDDDSPPTAAIGTAWEVPKQDSYWRSSGTYTYAPATRIVYSGIEEREWLCATDEKLRGNWIIQDSPTGHYFPTCDRLVLDQAPLNATQTANDVDPTGTYDWPGQELKIVFKVPSGRWEWDVVGEIAASVDSLGAAAVIAAFKNKLMEFGLGGLDLASVWGPSIPSLIREAISPDTLGRYHLHDDWCYSRTGVGLATSWPISSSNIISVGGSAVNDVTEYFNDFLQALDGTTVTGDNGRAGIYAVTCWDRDMSEYCFYEFPAAVTERYGYAVISTYKDKNGTIGFIVEGWSGQDTYFAAKWFDEHKYELQHINLHVTDLILRIEYKYSDGDPRCPPVVTIREKLGTISEKPQHDCP
jgi:hypothetical protein